MSDITRLDLPRYRMQKAKEMLTSAQQDTMAEGHMIQKARGRSSRERPREVLAPITPPARTG